MTDRSTAITFSDDEMSMIRAAAAPLPPWQRGPFLANVAQELVGKVRGAGLLFRTCADLQRQYLNGHVPNLRKAGRWDR
jgi:hypothetical protein